MNGWNLNCFPPPWVFVPLSYKSQYSLILAIEDKGMGWMWVARMKVFAIKRKFTNSPGDAGTKNI